jgi:hypothetical protein
MSEKIINMTLKILRTWCAFFGCGEFGNFHCNDCCLVITIHPCIITGYDIGDEVGVISGLLFEFPADRNAMGLLVVAQQSWHKFHRNASHVQIVHQNVLNGPVWQSCYLTNIVDSSPTMCKDSLGNFCYVFRCCACRRSSRTLTVIDRCSSVLDAFVPLKSFALAPGIISEGFLLHSVAFCSSFF